MYHSVVNTVTKLDLFKKQHKQLVLQATDNIFERGLKWVCKKKTSKRNLKPKSFDFISYQTIFCEMQL